MKIEYNPKGTCSTKMIIEENNGVIDNVEVIGGCSANLKGIASLVKGMKVEEVISRLEGIKCGNKPTSCPDQLAQALKENI